MWARLNSADAALMEARVEEMARWVCDADPRGIDQRRANALTAAVTAHRIRLHLWGTRLPRRALR